MDAILCKLVLVCRTSLVILSTGLCSLKSWVAWPWRLSIMLLQNIGNCVPASQHDLISQKTLCESLVPHSRCICWQIVRSSQVTVWFCSLYLIQVEGETNAHFFYGLVLSIWELHYNYNPLKPAEYLKTKFLHYRNHTVSSLPRNTD